MAESEQAPAAATPTILLPDVERPGFPCVQLIVDAAMGGNLYNIVGDPAEVLASLRGFTRQVLADRRKRLEDGGLEALLDQDPLTPVWTFTEPVYGETGHLTYHAVTKLLHVGRSFLKVPDPELVAAALNRAQRRQAARVWRPGEPVN